MLGWYQKYEDYKRHHQAFNGDIRYKNKALHLPNLEDQLTFRNSGVGLDKNKKRNLVQLYSTEGAVSSFFTHLSTSNLQNHYLDTAFYLPFLYDSNAAILQSPESFFTPLQNQFIKYFYVLHHYVVFNNSSKAQLIDFIDGYIKTFPSEESKVRKIFIESLGREYSNELPPPLWLLVKNHQHRLLTFDPFDAITVPIYTFDLNAAEIEDLQTIKGMTRNAAQGIVDYRENNGYYSDLEQLKKVPGLSEELRREIISAKFENSYFEESLKDFEPKLSIGILILNPLKYILSRAAIYYLFLFGVMYFALIRQKTSSAKQVILLFIKYLLLWVLFVIAGLVSVFIAEGNAYLYIILLFILSTLIALLVYRKRKKEMQRTLVFTGTMCLLLLTSVV